MILFFDTETTGTPKNYDAPASDVNNWPRLVQLAFIKTDWEGNIIDSKDFIIKPQGFTIPKESTKFHGITNEFANESGSNLKEVLELFNNEIERASILVAHNIKFDKKIIAAEFFRNNITSSILNRTNICTMESSTNFCALSGNKWPKLSELYKKLFNEEFQEQHNAKHDIFATYKCFWELNRREIIKVSKPEPKKNKSDDATIITQNCKIRKRVSIDDNTFLIPYRKGDKWGFCTQEKEIVIDCIYDGGLVSVEPFSEGLAKVQIHGEYIDNPDPLPFGDNDKIWIDGKFGYIDKTGKQIIPCMYTRANDFSEGLAAVMLCKIEGTGEVWLGYWGKWGFIDRMGTQVIPCIYDYNSAYKFTEGIAKVNLNKKSGCIDKIGKQIIPFKYDYIGDFSEGIAKVEQKDNSWERKDKVGYIDKNGNEITPCIYDSGGNFKDGLAVVELKQKDSKLIYIDGTYMSDKLHGYIDKTGKQIIPFIYKYAYPFIDGIAKAFLHKGGFINKIGNKFIPFIYEEIYEFSEGLAGVKLKDKYGFIDKNGKQIIPFIYEGVMSFSEGLAAVELNGKWGFIDKSGREIIPCVYYRIYRSFIKGVAIFEVYDKNFTHTLSFDKNFSSRIKYGFINILGNEITPCLYDQIMDNHYQKEYDLLNGFKNDNYKIYEIDKINRIIIIILYGKFGFFNYLKKEIIPCIYEYAHYFSNGLAQVKLNGKYGYIDMNGTQYWED